MANMFGPSMPNRSVPNAPTLADPALAAARNATVGAAQGVYGRFATDKTKGHGDSAPAPVTKKTLLGA